MEGMRPNFKELFKGPLASKEMMVAKKFARKVSLGKFDRDSLVNDEDVEQALVDSKVLIEGVSVEEIIQILREKGVLETIVEEEVEKLQTVVEPEVVSAKLSSEYRLVDDKELSEQYRTNVELENKRKQIQEKRNNIFEDQRALDELNTQAVELLQADIDYGAYVAAGLYTQEEVEKHQQQVADMELIFAEKSTPESKETKKIATIFEAIMVKGINLSKCLGEDVIARPAYSVDDVFAPKVDLYALLKNVPLGIDVSMRSIEGDAFVEKVEKILRTIKEKKVKGIKYFKNRDGQLQKDIIVPKVILSAEVSMIRELMTYFQELSGEEFSTKLKSHRLSREIVSQIVGGSRIIANFAKEEGNQEMSDRYSNIIKTINDIAEESLTVRRLMVGAGNDSVSRRIQKIVDEFKVKEINMQLELEEVRKNNAA